MKQITQRLHGLKHNQALIILPRLCESGIQRSLAGWSGSSALTRSQLRYPLASGSGRLGAGLGLEDPFPRQLTQVAGQVVPAVAKALSVHIGLSTGLLERPHSTAAGFPRSRRSKSKGGSRNACDLAVDAAAVPSAFRCVHAAQLPLNGRGEHTGAWTPGRRAILELATTVRESKKPFLL